MICRMAFMAMDSDAWANVKAQTTPPAGAGVAENEDIES